MLARVYNGIPNIVCQILLFNCRLWDVSRSPAAATAAILTQYLFYSHELIAVDIKLNLCKKKEREQLDVLFSVLKEKRNNNNK